MFIVKDNPNLSKDGKILENVEIKNHELIILNNDIIRLNSNGWFINGCYQGKEAKFIYKVENPVILDKELFYNIFEEEKLD